VNSNLQRAANFILGIFLCTGIARAQIAGSAGAFARMGSGARGMGMGNAMTAVNSGDVQTYYNPSLAAFSENRSAGATFGILSMDRSLNFLNYTQPIHPTAGVSFGIINAGVKNIDGRDADGEKTGDLSTFENQFYLAFSNRVSDRVSLGVAVKLYYSKLYDQVTSTTVGFDVGFCAQVTDNLTLGGAIQDLNSKYTWDTKVIYDQNGKTTTDKFPTLRRFGVALRLPSNLGLVSAEFENTSMQTNVFRAGAEYYVIEYLTLRAGIDRIDPSSDATGAKPTLGFTIRNSFIGLTPSVTYAYVFESFAPQGMHIITLSTTF
jgi:hypothetical protein